MLRIILVERYPYFPLLKVGGLSELSLLARISLCGTFLWGGLTVSLISPLLKVGGLTELSLLVRIFLCGNGEV